MPMSPLSPKDYHITLFVPYSILRNIALKNQIKLFHVILVMANNKSGKLNLNAT